MPKQRSTDPNSGSGISASWTPSIQRVGLSGGVLPVAPGEPVNLTPGEMRDSGSWAFFNTMNGGECAFRLLLSHSGL